MPISRRVKRSVPKSKEITHAELVSVAHTWLETQGCSLILLEPDAFTQEKPDAIGWQKSGFSLVVECKVSKADFIKDKDKPFRKDLTRSLGSAKYFLTPKGLIGKNDIPKFWGLIEIDPSGKLKVIKFPEPVNPGTKTKIAVNELKFLVSFLSNYNNQG